MCVCVYTHTQKFQRTVHNHVVYVQIFFLKTKVSFGLVKTEHLYIYNVSGWTTSVIN